MDKAVDGWLTETDRVKVAPPDGKLKMRTLELLKHRPRTLLLDEIAARAQVTGYWLIQLSAGNIHDPGVDKIERLYEVLSGKQLSL